ncbi:hypothetical protein RRG08_047652 [Elysia crispata]|uniref:Ig-like domain-containing protein n=1 Tax=Elysia crispata TaxID=231223 RepID=A0AAE0ZWS2_9GAST|nr:hypothetical protein RRG08_047652 [Elysia crispata]
MDDDVDDRYAGIDIDSLLNRNDTRRGLSYGRKKALYEAPEFLQRLNGEETIMEGQALCLECKVQGFPVPTLRWYKDDEEIIDHPRIKVQSDGKGAYALLIDNVMRGDEAAYRCRAENVEGACSSVFFLSVRAKPRNSKKDSQRSPNRRTVSFPPMFSTIVEKVEEEEKQGKEFEMLPPSPLTDCYYALTLKSRATWPAFLGDWAFKNGNRRGSDAEVLPNGDVSEPQSPSEGRENARRNLRRSDLTARVHAKKQRLDDEKKQREEEERLAAQRKKDREQSEAEKKKKEEEEKEKEEVRKKLEEKKEEERKLETKLILEREERRRKRAELERESAEKEEAMKKRREARAERLERERREREQEEERWRKQEEEEEKQKRLKAEKQKAEEELQREEEKRIKEEALKVGGEDKSKSLGDTADRKSTSDPDNRQGHNKPKPKAFQMFQEKVEAKPPPAIGDKSKPGVISRFQDKFESKPAAEDGQGKPGKLQLPGNSLHLKMAAVETRGSSDQGRVIRDRSPGGGHAQNSSSPAQPNNIPEKTEAKKLNPWQKREVEVADDQKSTKVANVPAWKKDLRSKKEQDKTLDEAKLKDEAAKKEKERQEDERRKTEEKKQKVIEETKRREEEKLREEKKRLEAKSREEAKRKEEKLKEEKRKAEEKKRVEAKLREEAKRKEEEKLKEERKKADEKKLAEERLKQEKKELEDKKKRKEGKERQEAEEKRKVEEQQKREELIKADLLRKQAAQREMLQKKKEEEEAKKKEQREKEEQERMRLQFRKEQLRKEQLKRQKDEEVQRMQRKKKEEEEKKRKEKQNQTVTSPDEDAQVKVYKRDYSFSDLRKSLEATLTRGGAPVMDAEEHKYWDDILEKHNYSIGDIKKTFDSFSSGSATLDRPTRLRSRRNSIEELELVKMKRSSSISDLRESYTKSLERPKSKKKASDPDKVKKDEAILKRTANISETRQQLLQTVKKQLEPLTGGMSTKEADITIRNLKTKTAETPTARSPVGPMPTLSPTHPQAQGSNPFAVPGLNNLSISVKSKRASFHEMISQQQTETTPSLRIASSSSGKDLSKRKSYHGHDAYGSREIPVYRRVAGWTDEIGKSRDVTPQSINTATAVVKDKVSQRPPPPPQSAAAVPSSSTSSSAAAGSKVVPSSARPTKLSIPGKPESDVRPFVFNSTRTIARRFKAES